MTSFYLKEIVRSKPTSKSIVTAKSDS